MEVKKTTLDKIDALDFNRQFAVNDVNHECYSYNEFFSGCLSMAMLLKEKSEKCVFAVLDNSIELAALYFSVIFANMKIVVVDPEKGSNEIHSLLEEQDSILPIIKRKDTKINVEVLNAFNNHNANDCKREVLKKIGEYDFEENYLTTYTSGTNGKTKGVVNSLSNLFYTSFELAEKIGVLKGGTFLHLMPMTYMAGILNSIIMPFIYGYKIVFGPRFSVKRALTFWKCVEEYNVNLLWMSPMMLTMIDSLDRSEKYTGYCKKHNIVFLIGTAPLSRQCREKFESRYGSSLYASYGLSETLFISVETNKSLNEKKEDNVGELLNSVEYIINQDSELCIKVPWMFKGYTNENTSKYFSGDYYLTGDLAKVTNGTLSIIGRKKDLIIRGGMNISPKVIEDCILDLNVFDECAVFGIKNRFDEEEVCCAYVISNGTDDCLILEKKVAKYVVDALGLNYSINAFKRMTNLPRNLNGKVDKNALKGIILK